MDKHVVFRSEYGKTRMGVESSDARNVSPIRICMVANSETSFEAGMQFQPVKDPPHPTSLSDQSPKFQFHYKYVRVRGRFCGASRTTTYSPKTRERQPSDKQLE